MKTVTVEDKLALLIRCLPTDVRDALLSRLAPSDDHPLRVKLREWTTAPPDPRLLENLLANLDEFLNKIGLSPGQRKAISSKAELRLPQEYIASVYEAHAADGLGVKSEDPLRELRRMDLDSLCFALEGETPRTIALVLGVVSADRAAEVMEMLPTDVCTRVTLEMASGIQAEPEVVRQVAKALVAKAEQWNQGKALAIEPLRVRRMAEMLRRLPASRRTEILTSLDRDRPHIAVAVRNLLGESEHRSRAA